MKDNNIDGVLCCEIFKELHQNLTLIHLDLSGNPINDDGCEFISSYLNLSPSIEILNLFSTKIGEIGCELISKSLDQNVTLKCLNLMSKEIKFKMKDNNIGLKGSNALFSALNNETIEIIRIGCKNLNQ
jgi:Ran GTPase-activating protein (RanGAP) involved in mRNA processing and transport